MKTPVSPLDGEGLHSGSVARICRCGCSGYEIRVGIDARNRAVWIYCIEHAGASQGTGVIETLKAAARQILMELQKN